jgi:antitoxin component of RelBE/YafQ-DinJ toxin-antitoxin module
MRKTDFIGLRIEPSTTQKLDKVARVYGVSNSTVIRELLANCDLIYPILKAEKPNQDTTALELRVRESIKGRVPSDLDPEMVAMVGEMVNRIMTGVAEELVNNRKD